MILGAPELLIVIVVLGLPLWGAIDAATRPDPQWTAANQMKILWIVLQLALGPLAAIVYFVAIRPKLIAAST